MSALVAASYQEDECQPKQHGNETPPCPHTLNQPTAYVHYATELLKSAGLRLTQPRRHVIQCLALATQPVNAYDIHERLKAKHTKVDVVSIYRILECLSSHHLIHEVASSGKVVRCQSHHHQHYREDGSAICDGSVGGIHVLMVCQSCQHVRELHHAGLHTQLTLLEKEAAFHFHAQTLSLLGYCSHCCPTHQHPHTHH